VADAAHVEHHRGGERAPRSVDAVVTVLAGRQHGVVTRGQLIAAGVGRRAVERRIEWGLLHPLHRGVYAVGHLALRREAWWMAAVLAAGDGAVLSYRSAAALWGVRDTGRARIELNSSEPIQLCMRLKVPNFGVIAFRPRINVFNVDFVCFRERLSIASE